MYKCDNPKIIQVINTASASAVVGFLEKIQENTKYLPEGDLEGTITLNCILIGLAKIMANTISLTTKKEHYKYAVKAFCDSIQHNAQDILDEVTADDDSTV